MLEGCRSVFRSLLVLYYPRGYPSNYPSSKSIKDLNYKINIDRS